MKAATRYQRYTTWQQGTKRRPYRRRRYHRHAPLVQLDGWKNRERSASPAPRWPMAVLWWVFVVLAVILGVLAV